ncbi:MAG: nuclear transport factor 2 family protein [Gemmatimonadaceae bacterium]
MHHHTLGKLFLVTLLAACATTPSSDPLADERAIRDIADRMEAAVTRGDADAIASLYSSSSVFLPANAPAVHGAAAIRAWWSEMLGAPNMSLVLTPTSIDVAAAGDMAEAIGTFRFGMDTPDGRFTDEGKYVVVYEKLAGEWKISSDIFNSDIPLPEPPQIAAAAEPAAMSTAHAMLAPGEFQWRDGPASLPGTRVAVLEGNPAEPGPFTMRISAPAEVTIPPHWHPGVEHITVVAGRFHLGMGETADWSKAKAIAPHGFAYMPPRMAHFARLDAGTTIQLHGTGPWSLTYVNPADDPRNRTP